jgi:hypothetical protein
MRILAVDGGLRRLKKGQRRLYPLENDEREERG